ncbi:MAG: arginine--tRNA ligase [Firmicutes bacterium]|nr:arginine--tRNA ligase [Bacillota bacterium]
MDFITEISKIIASAADLPAEETAAMIEVPADNKNGDFAFPCFRLAKTLRKAPPLIAQDIASKIDKPDFITDIQVVNAYINFYVNKEDTVKSVVSGYIENGTDIFKSSLGAGKVICIDYSSPNIAKPFHVGHLRSTVIGNALKNIYTALGYKVVGINHLGDWGTQFGKLIVAYKMWGDKEAVERDDIKELSRIYVQFHKEAEEHPELNDEARSWLVKMQEGDKEALELWKWFCDISMKEFNRIYDRLGITFDSYAGESFYNDKMQAAVDEIREKGLLTTSEGAQIVDLEKYNMPPCLILRSDGGTLYPTRDISAALYRKNTYDFYKCLYITALDQNLHFAQWFKVLELMGYDWAADSLVHIPFGLVSLGDGKLSTRQGHVVLMEDILNQAVDKARAIIEEKNPDLENKDKVAEDVGIGAVIFDDMFNSRIKNIVFDLDRMLSFEGETGPYVQYTHARACNILKRAGFEKLEKDIDYSLISDEASVALCKAVGDMADKVKEAADKNEPYIVSRQLIEVCKQFNRFYNENNIMQSDDETKKARLAVVCETRDCIRFGLGLLGINAPESM